MSSEMVWTALLASVATHMFFVVSQLRSIRYELRRIGDVLERAAR